MRKRKTATVHVYVYKTIRNTWEAVALSRFTREYLTTAKFRRMTDEEILKKYGEAIPYGSFRNNAMFVPKKYFDSPDETVAIEDAIEQLLIMLEKRPEFQGKRIKMNMVVWDSWFEAEEELRKFSIRSTRRTMIKNNRRTYGPLWFLKEEQR